MTILPYDYSIRMNVSNSMFLAGILPLCWRYVDAMFPLSFAFIEQIQKETEKIAAT